MPQWASGRLTTMGYVGSAILAHMSTLPWNPMDPITVSRDTRSAHDRIEVESEANAFRNSLLDGYSAYLKAGGKPC